MKKWIPQTEWLSICANKVFCSGSDWALKCNISFFVFLKEKELLKKAFVFGGGVVVTDWQAIPSMFLLKVYLFEER